MFSAQIYTYELKSHGVWKFQSTLVINGVLSRDLDHKIHSLKTLTTFLVGTSLFNDSISRSPHSIPIQNRLEPIYERSKIFLAEDFHFYKPYRDDEFLCKIHVIELDRENSLPESSTTPVCWLVLYKLLTTSIQHN